MKSKIESLQVLRAFAAIFVVINHLWGDHKTQITQSLGLNIIGSFGVDAFFILSGFIMCYKTHDDSTFGLSRGIGFLIRRIERIYPVFLIILFPFIILYLRENHPASFYEVIGNIFLLPSFTSNTGYHMLVGPAWSLVYEMFFYLIYAAMMLVVKNKTQLVIGSASLLMLMVVIVDSLGLRGPELEMSNFSYMVGDPLMLNFAMGCLYALLFTKIQHIKIPIFFASLLAVALFILGMYLAKHGFIRLVAFGLPAMAIVITFSLMTSSDSWIYRLLVYMGNASYSIYITHFLTLTAATILLAHKKINHDLFGMVFSVIAVVVACVFYSLIEKRIIRTMPAITLPGQVQREY